VKLKSVKDECTQQLEILMLARPYQLIVIIVEFGGADAKHYPTKKFVQNFGSHIRITATSNTPRRYLIA
jgi:hypothetical protein